jgi:hypothetical protein
MTKDHNSCIVTTIHTASDSLVTIDNICSNNDQSGYFEKKVNARIFSQCKLTTPTNNEQICLKNYMTKYRDDLGNYNHNLDNIIQLNHPELDTKEAMVNLIYYENGKKQSSILPYENCSSQHINYLYNVSGNKNEI